MAITNIFDQLRRDEDERQFAYDDANGKTLEKGATLRGNLTIGIGHNLTAKGLSPAARDFIAREDVHDADIAIEANFSWALDLDAVRYGAMQNLVFNMGSQKLLGFHNFIAAMKAKAWATAKAALLDSAADHEEPARIARLGLQIESGFWQ